MQLRPARLADRWPAVAGAVAVLVALPVLTLGAGTDLDTGAVIGSGRRILDGDYVASRPPGAPVHEASVGVLEALGGTLLSNAGSLAMAVVLVLGLVRLLRDEGVEHAPLAAAFVAANPWFQVAATSTVDFVWAMSFTVLGALSMRRGRGVLAGVLFALAIGTRMSTVLVVAAAVAAQLLDRRDPARVRTAVGASVVAAGVAAIIYLPPFLAGGSSLAFADNDFATSTPLNHVGRAFAKDLYFFGPYACVALALVIVPLWRSLPSWRTCWALRFGLLAVVASQALFLRFPWKMGHLIPTLVGLAVVLAVVLGRRPALLALLVVAQLLFGLVNIELFEPDNPNDARGARVELDVRWGPFIVDTRCRAQDEDAWAAPDRARVESVWNCAKPWGTGP